MHKNSEAEKTVAPVAMAMEAVTAVPASSSHDGRSERGLMAVTTAALASSSHDGGLGRVYEVFLSFRGLDTHLTIADSLYETIKHAGISIFKDDEELQVGKEIEGSLLQVINKSRIYILIFSKNYASSKWCLRELTHIVKLSRDDDEKMILPIFYDVDADDVKLKTELYREALQKHESDSEKDIAKQWEEALREVGRIKGWNLKDYGLYRITNLMVEEVSSLLRTRRTDLPNHLVGIKDRMDHIMNLLDLGAFDVRFIVIHGMGGIGKTTLVEAVFRQISPQFQGYYCFLKDVRSHDIINLQKKLLSDILNLSCPNLSFIDEGTDLIKTRFHGKKVLVVLDDIDSWDQIMRLADKPNWLGGGSRIIITTRNIEFLVKEGEDDNVPTSNSGQFSFYDMPDMNSHDALQLFCECSLGCAKPPPNYMDITIKLINVLGGLPLALNVVGSMLRGKCRSTWEGTLCKLKKVMNEDVKKQLMISYKALEPIQQQIYLDIACFFFNKEKTTAVKYWHATFGYPTEIEINILKRMSLIKISDNDRLWMHDQLRDLGRNIVHPESGEIHMRGSRLWSPEDAFHVVLTETVAKQLKILQLEDCPFLRKMPKFSAISQLEKLILRCLRLRKIDKSIGNLQHLDYLKIESGAIESLPESIGDLKSLAVLRIDRTLLVKPHSNGNLVNAKHLILPRREFQKLPNSIGQLESLLELDIRCSKINELPHSIGNLERLKFLCCSNCYLENLPDSIGRLQSLVNLDLSGSRIKSLPDCIGNLKSLKVLNLNYNHISELPKTIGMLENLKWLDAGSKHLKGEIPSEIGALSLLKFLNLSDGRFSALPTTINQLSNLLTLELHDCDSIQQLPELPKSLMRLTIASKSLTTIPDFSNLTNLVALYVVGGSVREQPNIEGIERLRALRDLTLSVGKVALPPTDFSSLSQLYRLRVSCADSRSLTRLPSSLRELSLEDVQSPIDWSVFSNLENLLILCIGSYSLREIQFEVLGKLQKFNRLWMSKCPLLKTMSVLPGLKEIKALFLEQLPQLTEIQGLGELKSLQDLSIRMCNSIKSLNESDVSNLQNLKRMEFWSCESLESVLGVPKSCQLIIRGCPRFNRDGKSLFMYHEHAKLLLASMVVILSLFMLCISLMFG
ncbi:hypothetical protein BT93_L1700 [Corymbia citriodora subsp. variegata]|uniref:TIR domain-containing protein n=1 Tax=Corymbia citriodora subsp. variegata TaxID=360336 RepID=A0A8T0CR44_CORYI|nr:hypothetical protein BT93_L1700 [Corymbia citriodora subsp. variegata]